MTVRRGDWNRSKLHGSSVRGLIISNIPYCDDAAIEGSVMCHVEGIKYSFLGNHY